MDRHAASRLLAFRTHRKLTTKGGAGHAKVGRAARRGGLRRHDVLGAGVGHADREIQTRDSSRFRGSRTPGTSRGAGAAIHEEYQIEGTEDGGFPPPIVGVNFYLPSGTTLHTTGFPTCAKSVLEQTGPTGCPKSSEAGPIGSELGIVSFGSERVEESATRKSFYAPGGGLEFFTNGYSPVSLEILWGEPLREPGGGGGGFGPGSHHRSPARLDGAGCSLRVARGQIDSRSNRLGLQVGRQNDLLRPGPHQVPDGRVPDQDRSDLRRRRGQPTRAGAGDGHLQGPLPKRIRRRRGRRRRTRREEGPVQGQRLRS